MRKIVVLMVLVLFIAGCQSEKEPASAAAENKLINEKPIEADEAKAGGDNMKLASVFDNGQAIPAGFTCDGENISPPLTISNVPENAKSLALIMDDPDAPSGTFVHWVAWNLKPATEEAEIKITKGSISAEEGRNDFGKNGYGGPCPPSGTHHYQFKLYALDTSLELPSTTTKQELEKAMQGHVVAETKLVGVYSRE